MIKQRLVFALAALAALGACATATPYQAATDSTRGYASQQIEANRWQVSFSGNSLTERQTVETYLLYRAAELTAQQGYDHFRVVQRDTEATRSLIPTGFGYDPFYPHFACDYRFYGRYGRLGLHPYGSRRTAGFGFRSGYGYQDPFWGGYDDYREVIRYDATAEIMMGKGAKPSDPAYFNANEVLMNLSNRIQRPEA